MTAMETVSAERPASERGLRPRNLSSGEVSEGGEAPRRCKYGAKTPKGGAA
jgi:hypothetical protein